MARKGKQSKHVYKVKHLEEWKELMAPPKEKPLTVIKSNPNVNQLWRWDTLEDIKQ